MNKRAQSMGIYYFQDLNENTTWELVESEACAAFMKQEYGE